MGDLSLDATTLISQAERDAAARRANGDGARFRLFTAYADRMKADRSRIVELEKQIERLEAQLQAERVARVDTEAPRRGPGRPRKVSVDA